MGSKRSCSGRSEHNGEIRGALALPHPPPSELDRILQRGRIIVENKSSGRSSDGGSPWEKWRIKSHPNWKESKRKSSAMSRILMMRIKILRLGA